MDKSLHRRPIEFRGPSALERPQSLACPGPRARVFPAAAPQRIPGGDHAASAVPAPGIVSAPFPRRRLFSGKKYRCKKPTLQLSSYVVESRVFSHDEASFYAGFCRV
ncbi:hypothetical protein [Burkholderia stabilis]|uniref:hypothetical protein n=1 Tax=Burkholderia stabilis TaxID=95485 RepID=UPI001E3BD519|nr:hypothetical protein [Burkholderia stabilis]